jgi:hypothetical protein
VGELRRGILLAVTAVLAAAPGAAAEPSGSFDLVGSDPLLYRGMNAALAVHGDYVYVGSRTDGSHPNAGVMVVNASDPSNPQVVGQIGPPEEGNLGESSRELRIWPRKNLLIVLNFQCDEVGHACAGSELKQVAPTFRFYDISGDNAAAPKLVSTYHPSRLPHEFFLWQDSARPDRALLYISTPNTSGADQLLVTDISGARDGSFRELASWRASIPPSAAGDGDVALHSLSVSPNGTRAYFAHLGAGFFIADTSEFAAGRANRRIRLITRVGDQPFWPGPGAHSAVPLFGSAYALTTDEVYGAAFGFGEEIGFDVLRGCPWGWVRLLDVSDPAHPFVASEYRIHPFNDPDYCPSAPSDQENGSSYSSHNPTLTRHLAFVTWHSGGLQAIDISSPAGPTQAAEFRPDPRPVVATEDPALSLGRDKVVMWSYPVIQDGLLYVVDIRNGLYILRYRGPFEQEVSCLDFLEGNSNLGWTPTCHS